MSPSVWDPLEELVLEFREDYSKVSLFHLILKHYERFTDHMVSIVMDPYRMRPGRLYRRFVMGAAIHDPSRAGVHNLFNIEDVANFVDGDDVAQVIRVYLMVAIRRFRKSKRVSFRHYSYLFLAIRLGRWAYKQMSKGSPCIPWPVSYTVEYDLDLAAFCIEDIDDYLNYLRSSPYVRLGYRGNMEELLGYNYDYFRTLVDPERMKRGRYRPAKSTLK